MTGFFDLPIEIQTSVLSYLDYWELTLFKCAHSIDDIVLEPQTPFHFNNIEWVADKGYTDILKWMVKNGYSFRNSTVCAYAARNGHFKTLKWAVKNGCLLNASVCDFAAGKGHLDIVTWLRDNGCEWSGYAYLCAARNGGRFDVIKWLEKKKCPWNSMGILYNIQREALLLDHKEMLEWTRKKQWIIHDSI